MNEKKELQKIFQESISFFKVSGKTAFIHESSENLPLMSILWSENEIHLYYRPKVFRFANDRQTLRAAVDHELCHYFTQNTNVVATLNGFKSTSAAYVDVFREYLAEHFFNKRFPGRKIYVDFKKRIFQPDEIIQLINNLDDTAAQLVAGGVNPYFWMIELLLTIFYDSVYFQVIKDETFKKWCYNRKLNSIYELFSMMIEDFDLIISKHPDAKYDHESHSELIFDSFTGIVGLDFMRLFQNILLFVPNFGFNGWKAPEMISLWQKRLVAIGKNPIDET
jgi:hypothetical protein